MALQAEHNKGLYLQWTNKLDAINGSMYNGVASYILVAALNSHLPAINKLMGIGWSSKLQLLKTSPIQFDYFTGVGWTCKPELL